MAYTVSGNRLLPLHSYKEDAAIKTPHNAIQSITMGIRIGEQRYAIGYIHKFSFTMKRETKPIWQIEPYPDMLGLSGEVSGISKTFSDTVFDEDTAYWPGEAIEVIPGKMGQIDITLDRYSLYTGNLLSALMRATGGGVYSNVTEPPNINPTGSDPIKYVSILQQVRPFDIYQIFVSPVTGGVLWGRKFGGVWLNDVGETAADSDKNEPIIEQGKAVATYIRPLSSSLTA